MISKIIGGRFKIIKRIGRGTFGKTYLAEDCQKFNSHCVVKELEPMVGNNPQVFEIAKNFFQKEARVLHELSHRHSQIPYLIAYFEEEQKFYIVQEFIEGHDLSVELKSKQKLSESEVISLLEDILEPLSFLHQQNLIHRDIKPTNLMRRKSNNRIVLIDFGAIKQVASGGMFDPLGQTKIGTIIGTPGYMPSEQTRGKARLSSDIYAVGAIGIQALTGILPYEIPEDPDNGELMWQHEAQVSHEFEIVLSKMVRYHFKERYPTAIKALKAIRQLRDRNKKSLANIFFINNFKLPSFRQRSPWQEPGIFNEINPFTRIYADNKIEPTVLVETPQQVGSIYQKITRKKVIKLIVFAGTGAVLAALGKNLFDAPQEQLANSVKNQKEHQPLKENVLEQPSTEEKNTETTSQLQPEIALKTFSFEVVTVNQSAAEIDRTVKEAKYFSEDLSNNIALEMVIIPSGSFTMGASANERYSKSNEVPQHQVEIKSFSMSKFQITQAQWREIAALPKIDRDLNPDPSDFKGDNLPVEQISWYDAIEFAARLSQKTGKEYRLPSEAEWEYACRANTYTPFYFGPTISGNLVNYNTNYPYPRAPRGNSRNRTVAVGSFPPNAFGLYDMHGNVWEWCADTWSPNYQNTPTGGSANREGNTNSRVYRGGSWIADAISCRSANREKGVPNLKYHTLGFRLASNVVSL